MDKTIKIVRLILIALLMLPAMGAQGAVQSAADIEAPSFGFFTKHNGTCWFADPDHMLANNLRQMIDGAIAEARDSTGLNIVGVYLDEYDGNLDSLAMDIHDQWHLGSLTGLTDNGVVILIVKKGDKAIIYTGFEASQKLPGANVRLIVSRRIMPQLVKHHDPTQAFINAAQGITQLVLDPSSATAMAEEPEVYEDINVWWIGGLCLVALLIAIVMKIRDKRKKQ